MLAALSPRGCLRELLDEGVALLLDGGDRGGGRGLVLLADGEVELLDGGVESLGLLLVATLVRNEVVHVEAEGTDLAAELVGGLGPVGLADVLTHVLVEALDGLGRANRGLGGGELLEVAAGVAVLAHGLGDVEITGLCESREETGSSVDARLSLQGCGFGWRGTNKLTTPRGDHVGSPRVGLDWPGTHLVDELETVLVGLALILELDRVERHGGGGLESDDTGREEGGSLRGRIRLEGEDDEFRVFLPATTPGDRDGRRVEPRFPRACWGDRRGVVIPTARARKTGGGYPTDRRFRRENRRVLLISATQSRPG